MSIVTNGRGRKSTELRSQEGEINGSIECHRDSLDVAGFMGLL